MGVDYVDFEVDLDELPVANPHCEARHILTRHILTMGRISMGPCDGVATWIAIRHGTLGTNWWMRALVCESFRRQIEKLGLRTMNFYPI